MKGLIINADGYGFTAGVTKAIEECLHFGTVSSISANVNFPHAEGLRDLVRQYPNISVGCHLNPVIGRPVSRPEYVASLINDKGEFWYRTFRQRFSKGFIDKRELREELLVQIRRTRELAGEAFTHVDFHMGLHRIPGLYPIFLDVAKQSGVGRIRTHKYRLGMESRYPRLAHMRHLLGGPERIPKHWYNLSLRSRALRRGLRMPDAWVEITGMMSHPERITVDNYLMMLKNLPDGCSEFVVHPGFVDDELRRWSTYLEPREKELQVLCSLAFRDGLRKSGVAIRSYKDIRVWESPHDVLE
jgi:predicted glycoside hydrolase/deacetylase ChbG (UPF0249 family)